MPLKNWKYVHSIDTVAIALEEGVQFKYARVCTEQTIPYSRRLEGEIFLKARKILEAAKKRLSWLYS